MSAVERGVVYDMTHLVSQIGGRRTTGIERVDVGYGQHFARDGRLACGIHFGLFAPHRIAPERAADIMRLIGGRRLDGDSTASDRRFNALRDWLAGETPRVNWPAEAASLPVIAPTLALALARLRHHLQSDPSPPIPHAGMYLNVSQYGFEHHRFFRWLGERPDLKKIFMLHDLLPLDYPEYFRAGYRAIFERRLATMVHHATALIVSTQEVRMRAQRELLRRGKPAIPICVAPLPSPLGEAPPEPDALLVQTPYFVMTGTIEPRKNHLLLLHVWRELAQNAVACPKLVILGARGWDNAQIVDLLERSPVLRAHVVEVPRLGGPSLRRLLANACALLMPSFAEGYGLPLVEALALGVPVVASDIPVFHEVTQGQALFASPLDGPAWRRAILALTDAEGAQARAARAQVATFRAPTPAGYFSAVETFMDQL